MIDQLARIVILALLVGFGFSGIAVGYLLSRDWTIAALIGIIATVGAAISDDTPGRT